MTIGDGGRVARSVSSTNSMAVVRRALGAQRTVIKYRLTRDERDNEGVVFGFVFACPPPSFDYTASGYDNGLFYRAYNGEVYCPSRFRSGETTRVKVHPSDVVTMRVDGVAGTVEVLVNDASQGVLWANLAGTTLYPCIGTYLSNREVTLVSIETVDSLPTVVPLTAVPKWDTASGASGPGITFTNEDHTARSTAGESLAVLSRGFGGSGAGSGKAVWSFRLDEDTAGNQMTCFGAVTKPIASRGYDTRSGYFLRAYNGALYGPGATGGTRSAVPVGETVTMTLDPAAGTLSVMVGTTSHGVCWTGLTSTTLFPAVQFYGSGRAATVTRAEEVVDAASLAKFDPSYSSAGDVEFSNEYHTVRSSNATNSMAVVGRGFNTRVRAAWEFRLDEDTLGNETTCFGATIVPPPSMSYDADEWPLMYRAYNAVAYGRGKASVVTARAKIHPGDLVRCEWDGPEGALSYFINGTAQGPVFTGLRDVTLFPAVCFYGSARQVSVVRCSEVSAVTPLSEGMRAMLSGVPAFSVTDSSPASEVAFTDGGLTVSSLTGSNAMAVLSRGFGATRATWEFKVVSDSSGDECTAYGAVIKPSPSRAYNAGGNNLFYRGYNAELYGTGAVTGGSRANIHPDDVVRCVWDGEAGTLTYFINGVSQGACFAGLRGKTVYPAVAFYRSGRTVSIIRCEESVDWAAIPRFDRELSSRGVEWRNDDHTFVTTEGGNKLFVVNRGFGRVRAAWAFRIDVDEATNQMVCFGATTLPVRTTSYDSGEDWPLAYRAYNGQLYGRGKGSSAKARATVGDVVTFEWDGLEGSLALLINGTHRGYTHTGLQGVTLYPAAMAYGRARGVSVVRCGEVDALTPSPYAGLYRVPRFDESISSGHDDLTWDDDGHTAVAASDTNTLAIVERPFEGSQRAVWSFRLEHDDANDERSAMGAVRSRYPSAKSYDSTPDVYMLRSYNGVLYGEGRVTSPTEKVHPGDTVRYFMDGPARNLYVYINGICQNSGAPVFTGISTPLWPAAGTYASGVRIMLTECDALPVPSSLPRFDRGRSSSGLEFVDDSRTVRTTGGSNSMAFVDRAFTRGRAAIEFFVETDNFNDEHACYGVSEPASNYDYSNGTTARVCRAYNGQLYGRSRATSNGTRIHKGDLLRMELDMDAGTLRYIVNGVADAPGTPPAFSGLTGLTLYPIVASYGSGVRVRLVRCESM